MTYLWEAIVGLVVVAALFFGGFYVGRLSVEVKDEKAVVKQQQQEAARTTADEGINQQIEAEHEKAIQSIPDPTPVVVCVRKYVAPVLGAAAPAAEGVNAAAAVSRTDNQPAQDDPGPDLARIGQAADAQVKELQEYVARECAAGLSPHYTHP